MRVWLALALALCLFACSQVSEAPPEPAETEAPADAQPPVPPPPPPTQPPAAEPAPTDDIRPRADQGATAAPSPPSREEAMRERVLTPVLVELMPTEAREPRQGGSAAIVLADPASALGQARNLALCQALFRTFDQATTREVAVGVRHGAEGELELLRPIYWLTRSVTPGQPGADRCPHRLDTYDYPRAQRIKRKLGLTGEGPYLVVERNDRSTTERVAAVIDLSRTRTADVPDMVRYFRDGFVQLGDIWDPRRYQPEAARENIASFFGRAVSMGLMPRLVRATRQIGCPLTNLLDICDGPG